MRRPRLLVPPRNHEEYFADQRGSETARLRGSRELVVRERDKGMDEPLSCDGEAREVPRPIPLVGRAVDL